MKIIADKHLYQKFKCNQSVNIVSKYKRVKKREREKVTLK